MNSIDPLLLRAAESTGQRGLFDSFNRVFSEVGEVNCWVRAPAHARALVAPGGAVFFCPPPPSPSPGGAIVVPLWSTVVGDLKQVSTSILSQ